MFASMPHSSSQVRAWLIGVTLFGSSAVLGGCGVEDAEDLDRDTLRAEQARATALAVARKECGCQGFSDEELMDCVAGSASSVRYNRCKITADRIVGGEQTVACFQEIGERWKECVLGVEGCDELAFRNCHERAASMSATCYDSVGDGRGSEHLHQIDICLRDVLEGDPEGCLVDVSSSELGDAVFEGTTVLRGDDVSPPCSVLSSEDVDLEWVAPASGRYRFSTTGSAGAFNLMARRNCSASEVLACGTGHNPGSFFTAAEIELELGRGESIVLTVDAFNVNYVGPYQVSVAPVP